MVKNYCDFLLRSLLFAAAVVVSFLSSSSTSFVHGKRRWEFVSLILTPKYPFLHNKTAPRHEINTFNDFHIHRYLNGDSDWECWSFLSTTVREKKEKGKLNNTTTQADKGSRPSSCLIIKINNNTTRETTTLKN